MIYTVEISDGNMGCEQYYLCSDRDHLDSLCYTDEIIDTFLDFIGSGYPDVEEILNDDCDFGGIDDMYEAEEILNDMVTSQIEYKKTESDLSDLNNLEFLPNSCIYIESDEYILYKSKLSRDVEIDKILKD